MAGRMVILEDTLALVLAGGQGERLLPLTRDRSKPAVPFGGMYRIVDFTLSNCLNSGLRKIYVLTQYKSGSLERHIQLGWSHLFSAELGEFIFTVPPQLRVGQRWYEGTADAVFHIDPCKPSGLFSFTRRSTSLTKELMDLDTPYSLISSSESGSCTNRSSRSTNEMYCDANSR